MRRFVITITILVINIFGCVDLYTTHVPSEGNVKEYSTTAIWLSDFSMTIAGYYETQSLSVPKDFDKKQFFDVLEKKYPDQSHVKYVKENYSVSVRPLEGNYYSVMLCDPKTNRKIMEDLSCHLDRVEIRSWESSNADSQCVFESNWKLFCE